MAVVLTVDDLFARMEGAPAAVPLFAYGTLRPGEPLAGLVDVERHERGQVYGYSLYAYPEGAFPFMVYDRHGGCTGDLLWVTPNLSLWETVRMEMRAGYDVSIVNVYTSEMHEPIPALAFTRAQAPIGTQCIDTGDWKDVG